MLSGPRWYLAAKGTLTLRLGFPGGASGKEPTCQWKRHERCGFHPWVGKIPWRRKWQLTPVLLSGKSFGRRSLAGYSPWGCREYIPYWAAQKVLLENTDLRKRSVIESQGERGNGQSEKRRDYYCSIIEDLIKSVFLENTQRQLSFSVSS